MLDTQRKTTNVSAKAGEPDDQALVLVRTFDAPLAMVFGVWSDPEHVKDWWNPGGFVAPVYEMDFRVGGAYRFCIRRDGKDSWAHGVYREIDAPRRIVQTFQWDSGDAAQDRPTVITLTFEPLGDDATRMTFRQEAFATDDARHQHGQGWSGVLESFAGFLARQANPA